MTARGYLSPLFFALAAAGAIAVSSIASASELRLTAGLAGIASLAALLVTLPRQKRTGTPTQTASPPAVANEPVSPYPAPASPVPLAEGSRPAQVRERTPKYEPIRCIAAGGMGAVFLAWQHGPRSFRRQVVLKRLHARFANDTRIVDMFLNEAQLVAGLTHPNVVPIHELFQDEDGSYVLVMEYVCGPTLLAVLRERNRRGKGLPYGALVRIGGAICDALHHAYASVGLDGEMRRIIHRDVSPSNVMVRYDGEVKLLDFGLAMVTGADLSERDTVTGKLGYMSPEQLYGEELDHQTDVFSLGVVLWEMATGRRLYRRENDSMMIHAILRAPIPSPRSIAPAVNEDLEAIIMRTLARDRRLRYPDAASLAHDLRALADSQRWSRRRAELVTLVRETEPSAHATLDEVPTMIESEPSHSTDVIGSRDIEFTDDISHLSVDQTPIIAERLAPPPHWHTPV